MRGNNRSWFAKGMRDAIPIALGYLAVSFTLGIAAKNAGFSPFQAFLVSFAALVLVLSWVLPYIYDLFITMKQLFAL